MTYDYAVPTVVGIRVRCPECGATTQASGDVVKCQYCGTESRVQRRTMVFQQPVKLPPPLPSHPPRVAVQQTSRAIWAVFGVAAAGVMIPGAVAALTASRRTNRHINELNGQPSAVSKPHEPVYRDWQTQHPFFSDVDGDGQPDPIGIVRYVSNRDEMHFAAHSARDGKRLWEAPSLGTYSEAYQARFVVTDNVVLWGSETATRIRAFDVRTGNQLWDIAPQEGVQRFCRWQDATYVELKDNTLWRVDLAMGALQRQTKQIACKDFETTGTTSDLWNTRIEGVGLERAYAVAEGYLVSGAKSPGTPIPMIVALDKKRNERWRVVIPPVDPMKSTRTSYMELGFDDKQIAVAATYSDQQAPRLELIDRATGARQLDVPMPIKPESWMSYIPLTLQGDTVYAAVSSELRAFDRQTGKQRWVLPAVQ